MKLHIRTMVVLLPLALGAACSKSKIQPVSGQLSLSSFGAPVTTVRATRPGLTQPVDATVAADGTFTLPLRKGRQYQIEFLNSAGQPSLVMPRKAGSLDWRFDVRGGGPRFDMGVVRYVGNPAQIAVAFKAAQTSTGGAPAGDPDTVECEDGKDPNTGAVCADDNSGDQGNNEQCGNNEDPPAGGTPATPPTSAAVADKNLPPAIGGCDDEGDDESGGDSEK